MKKIILLSFLLVVALSPVIASAQTPNNPCTQAATQNLAPGAVQSTLPVCINQIYSWSLGIGSLLALFMIIGGGYFIMTSSGNGEQASRGKEMITGAIIGLVILFTAYLILYTINPDLTKLNIQSVQQLNGSSNSPRQ